MKSFPILLFLIGSFSLCPARAATLLLDDFSLGGFSLASDGTTSNSESFATPLTDQRTIAGLGFPDWTATLATEGLSINISQLNPSPGRTFIDIYYTLSSGTFSLLGYDAFAIDLSEVEGSGELRVSVDGSLGTDVRIPIDGSGTIVYPFSNLGTSQSLDSLTALEFRFYSVTGDFSLTIDNLRLVPEPSSSVLILFGAIPLLLQRRRR
ncbi:MAG: PEP-CTERM sorting domain-containing protein [Verrucomicrobiota bacterium JB025]|nr:PEP-CTERM sorting domain-containing protein [Verrucomicrobiota bacterium JB025]